MFYIKDIIKSKFIQFAILSILLFVIFPRFGYGREVVPLLEYMFNEVGSTAFCSGSYEPKRNLTMREKIDDDFVEADLHTEGGLGISGSSMDRAFNPRGIGHAILPIDLELAKLKSFTFQCWYKVEDIWTSSQRICGGMFFIYCRQDGAAGFRVNETIYSESAYTIVNEWVFFAVTFDSEQEGDNLKFYIGTKNNQVELVSTHIHPDSNLQRNYFWIGSHAGGGASFTGLLDNIRLYGSFDDNAGVLTLEELELIRRGDIRRPDPFASTVESNSAICLADGEDVVSVTVHVVDQFGGDFNGATVTLAGDNNFESIDDKVTGPDGKAVFE